MPTPLKYWESCVRISTDKGMESWGCINWVIASIFCIKGL